MMNKYSSTMAILMAAGFGAVFCGCATKTPPAVVTGLQDAITVPNESTGLNQALPAPADPQAAAATAPAPVGPEIYRIGPGDVLRFQSFNDDTISGEIRVRYDGYISLPLIQDLEVKGLTRDEAEAKLREAYKKEFIEPRLTLSIRDSRSKSYHVMGDVQRPDEYIYDRPVSLLDAVNTAGGVRQRQQNTVSFVSQQSQLTKAFIIRHQEGQRKVTEYDLRGFEHAGDHASDTQIWPGDIIYVPESVQLAYVMGQVARPNAYPVAPGMGLLELMALAGGPLEATGQLKEVVLIRQLNEKETRVGRVNMRAAMKAGVRVAVEPGDIIYVPRKGLVKLSQFVQQIQSTIAPALSMYMQAYDAYYTDRRYQQLVNSTSSTDGTLLTLEQTLRNLSTLTTLGASAVAVP